MEKAIMITTETGTFSLMKDEDTKSALWVCVAGRTPGALSNHSKNVSVPLNFAQQLRALALQKGYTPKDLSVPGSEEKAEKIRAKAEKKKRAATRKRKIVSSGRLSIPVGNISDMRARLAAKAKARLEAPTTDEA